MFDNTVQQPQSLLADPATVALLRDLYARARHVRAEHATYSFGHPNGRPYGPVEHTWTAGESRVSYSDGELIYKRHGVPLLHARHVTNPRQVADLLAAVGVIPQGFASAYQLGRKDGRWIADVDVDPDRKCRYCGATSGLKAMIDGFHGITGWQCWDDCKDSAR